MEFNSGFKGLRNSAPRILNWKQATSVATHRPELLRKRLKVRQRRVGYIWWVGGMLLVKG